ncbi:sodium- and chloride-dependent neutral and basic amino acid transporter B(0+)-like [Watersipora subatra]|uniref:sodium- and chloride-dependent neutral and basic amino acid transporter B(0+)-like n=1 Tax=Watersipora subatra TaxID=2589382 RepID=UPI00355C1114
MSNKAGQSTDELVVNFEEDENKARGNWGGQAEFLLSCLGYAVGLGNIWRFPYLCYKNGGALFLIPYAIMLFLVGIPIFVLELSLGQFTSSGPVTCWKFSRLFSGVGWGMVVVSALVATYYNMIIGWAVYYLVASFVNLPSNDLIWSSCIKGESSDYCSDYIKMYDATTCVGPEFFANQSTGVCSYANGTLNPLSGKEPMGIWNETLAEAVGIKTTVATDDYLKYRVWGRANSSGLGDIGKLKWELALCFLAAWLMVYFALLKGIKSSGKVVYFTAIFPYAMLIVLFIRGLMLEGYEEGIKFYMSADVTRLNDATVWKDAAVQIFFSLSASWGGLIALSSYNKFHNDCIRDSLVVSFSNCLTSFFAGFVIFSYLGHLAFKEGKDVENVVDSGIGLAFIVYTRAVQTIPAAPLWAVLFFLMLITLGLDSEFALVETLLTSYMDIFPNQRKKKWLVLAIMCAVMFFLGLPLCCEGGTYLFDILDKYSGGWNVLLLSLLECIAIAYTYGVFRFCRDIEIMISDTRCFVLWFIYKYWWIVCWCFLTPLSVTFVMMFDWLSYKALKYDDGREFEKNYEALGWMCTFAVVIVVFIPPTYHLVTETGSFTERLKAITNPTDDWGPALVEHRKLVNYVDGWVIDPDSPTQSYALQEGYGSDADFTRKA